MKRQNVADVLGGDDWRRVHGCEWITETQRRTTYC